MNPVTSANAPAHTQTQSTTLWTAIVFLMVLCYFLFFFNLGSYPLFDMDEPRYAEAAREMIESGNWITPHFNYDLRFDKPVFFYWLIALAYKAFGVSEFSARLFSAINASLTALMLLFLGHRFGQTRLGLCAAIVFASAVEVIGLARMSVTDMTLATYMCATTLCLFMVAHHSRKWWIAAGLCAALAILTKGPVGIVVPGAVLILYSLLSGQFKKCFITRWFPVALAIAAALSLPWYIAAYLENGQIFLDALFKHNVTRFEGVVSGHDYPIYFFIPVLLLGFMPWTLFLPGSVLYWTKQFKSGSFGQFTRTYADRPITHAMALFSLVWIVFIFLFFTTAQTKLLTYILPLFPALGLLMGATWEGLYQPTEAAQSLRKQFWISAAILALLATAAGIAFSLSPATFLPREAKHLSETFQALGPSVCLLLGLGLSAWLLNQRHYFQAVAIQGVTMALVVAIAMARIVPQINQATQGAVMSFLQQAGEAPLITYEMTRPSLTFYARKKILRVPQHDQKALNELIDQHGQLYIITKNSFMESLAQSTPVTASQTLIQKENRYSLVLLKSSKKNGTTPNSGEPVLMNAVEAPRQAR